MHIQLLLKAGLLLPAGGSVVGKKEAEGPLKNYFDKIIYDSYDGCDTFEQAESMFQGEALEKTLERSKTHANEG